MFSLFQASQLCLVEGVRNRYRARIGLRRHRHPEPDQDEHRHRDTDIRDLGARGVRRDLEEEEHELLEGAENGRYKVIAKAEPYKNLPVREKIKQKSFVNNGADAMPLYASAKCIIVYLVWTLPC